MKELLFFFLFFKRPYDILISAISGEFESVHSGLDIPHSNAV